MNTFLRFACLWLVLIAAFVSGLPLQPAAHGQSPSAAVSQAVVIDSQMTATEAFEGLAPQCPDDIRRKQQIVTVRYYGFDKAIHQGQLVVDADLAADIEKVFAVALQERFPIYSVIPIADQRFRQDGRWSDDLSMAANNTSAFNYRAITGGARLSNHATGRAIDINPVQNPYIKAGNVLPPGAIYDPAAPGTLTADHPIVQAFLRLGWQWGGHWTSLKDYQHFEKPLPN